MSVDKKRALGRGLDALLPTVATKAASGASYGERSVFVCPIEALTPQKGQPRQRIDDTRLQELAQSIRDHGLIEPLVVRRIGQSQDRFEIVAGERRWRAAQRAGIKELLVVVKDVSPDAAFELALIENLQREDLGPIEVAEAFERLIKEHRYTHETLADRLHKDRTTITNSLRLLKLPARIRALVIEGKLTEGHARALLGAPDEKAMEALADRAVRGRLSVRKVEAMVRSERGDGGSEKLRPIRAGGGAQPAKGPNIKDLEHRISRRLGLRVEVHDQHNKGQVVIHYGSLDDFDRLLLRLGVES
jgi:ParB family transcriptional regulator, chromosome partitioning protein